MRKPFIAVLVAGAALVASAYGQTPAPTAAPAAAEVSGTVLSTGNVMILVRGDDGQDRSLVLFNSTQMPDERIPPVSASKCAIGRSRATASRP
jgi:hypothetical protein